MTKKEKAAVPKSTAIIAALHDCFNAEAKNSVQIGRLLSRLRGEVEHGQWLPLLEREFSLSDRTARNYMGAFGFMTKVAAETLKSEKFSDLKLRPTALYMLASMYSGVDEFEFEKPAEFLDDERVIEVLPDDIAVILKEAKERWVGPTRLKAILRERHPPEPEPVAWPSSEAKPEPPEPEPADLADDDDMPPPPNPDPPPSERGKGKLADFETAIRDLEKMIAGSVQTFADVDVPTETLEKIADALRFLSKIITAAKKPRLDAAA
jgi:hypothetical protein